MNRTLLVLPLCFLATATAAVAQVSTYDSRDDFLGVTQPAVWLDFEETEAATDQSQYPAYERSGVRISASDRYLYIRNYSAASDGILYGADRENRAYLEIQPPPGTTAIGLDVSTFYTGVTGTVRITLASGEQYVVTVGGWTRTRGPTTFFGVVSAGAIGWIRLEALTNDDPRGFVYDPVLLDDIAVAFDSESPPAPVCTPEQPVCDADGDGEADVTDACPETPASADVDAAGCSQAEFCGNVAVRGLLDAYTCWLSDWRNDEPLRAHDCKVSRVRGSPSWSCVPR